MKKSSLLIAALFCLSIGKVKANYPVFVNSGSSKLEKPFVPSNVIDNKEKKDSGTIYTYPVLCAITVNAMVTNNVSCYGDSDGIAKVSPVGGLVPYTYSWSPIGSTIYLATGLSAGTYTVKVSDRNGCVNTSRVTVTQPTPLRDSVTFTNATCYGGTGNAIVGVKGGTSPYTYTWSPIVSSNAGASGLIARNYVVLVKDLDGCTSLLSFNITQPPAVRDSIVSAFTVNNLCNRGTAGSALAGVKYGTLPYTYSWSPNVSSTATAGGLSAGTYTLTVKDGCGNSASTNVTITQPSHIRDSVVATVICSGGFATNKVGVKGGTSPYTYLWTPGGGTNAIMSGLSNGTYTIMVTDKNGCSTTLTDKVKCSITSPGDDVDNSSGNECCQGLAGISVYPNPNSGTFTLSLNHSELIREYSTLEVYNMLGLRVYSSILKQSQTNFTVTLRNQPPGLYLYRVISDSGTLIGEGKLIIQK